jgi:serine/threonine protein kinase
MPRTTSEKRMQPLSPAPLSDDGRLVRWLAVLAPRYAILERHSSTHASWVFRAIDRQTSKAVAIKLLKDWNGASRDAFIAEGLLLSELEHPGIVRYLAHGDLSDGGAYIITEWLPGTGLDGLLHQGPLTVAQSLTLLVRTASILAAAHARGIVHLDLKPPNLFLVDGDPAHVRLLDFGLARLTRSVSFEVEEAAVAGTPGYMAPEQILGDPFSPATDVFALGCILFRCVVGHSIFSGEGFDVMMQTVKGSPPRVGSILDEFPPAIDALAASMLDLDPAKRPADAAAVLAAIASLPEAVLRDLSPSARALLRPTGLTSAERIPVLVALVRLPETDREGDTASDDRDTERPTPERRPASCFERLTDGTWIALPRGGNATALDQALHAARLVLDVRSRCEGAAVALAAGRMVDDSSAPDFHQLLVEAEELLAHAQAGRILLDEGTAALVSTRFDLVREEGAPPELVGPKRHSDWGRKDPEPVPPRQGALGRALEIRQVAENLRDAFELSRARVVLVTGPAGIGKSHVVREALQSFSQSAVAPAQWVAYGDSMSAGSSLHLAASLLRHGSSPAASAVLALLGRGRTAPGDGRSAADAGSVTEVHQAFCHALREQLDCGPLVVCLEDIHWADLGSLRTIDYALAQLAERPLCIVATARPDYRDLFPDLWQKRPLEEIRLRELDDRDAEGLVAARLGALASAAERTRIVHHARGNPFLLLELIRAAIDGRAEETSATVVGVVQSRLLAFDPHARRVLRAASILGESFTFTALRHILGPDSDAIDIEWWLGMLVDRAVLRRRDDGAGPAFAFVHALVRDASYDMLTHDDRRLGHRLAAEWLEAPGRMGPPVVIAQHYGRAGEAAGAGRWYHRATADAFTIGDLPAVVWCAEHALQAELPQQDRGYVQAVAAHAYRLMGAVEPARRLSAEALRTLEPNTPLWRHAARTAMMAGASSARHRES